MLIEFSVENFLSFRDRATLSLVAARPDRSLPQNVVPEAGGHKLDLLRSVAIYGPNASGKSNLLEAIRFATMLVRHSAQETSSDTSIPVVPFKLDAKTRTQPSTFEFVFIHEGSRYNYGFSVDTSRIWKEWLVLHKADSMRASRRVLFERDYDPSTGEDTFRFGPSWSGAKTRITELTRPNALFLSVATQFNHEQATHVHGWFSRRTQSVDASPIAGEESYFTARIAYEDATKKESFLRFLQQADTGIVGFSVKATPLQQTDAWKTMPAELRKHFPIPKGDKSLVYETSTVHPGIDERGKPDQVLFDLQQESDGTQKLYALSGPWLTALAEGITIVADELDLRLHPMLTKWLISWFHSPQVNPKGAQLIFATHDDNLLDLESFRRDQIWFVERDEQGASSLYSLWDFKKQSGRGARKQENIRRGYLAGRYGAVPFLEDIHE